MIIYFRYKYLQTCVFKGPVKPNHKKIYRSSPVVPRGYTNSLNFLCQVFFFYIYPPLKLVPNSQCNGGELIFFFSFFVQLKALKNYIWNLSSGVSFIYTLDNPLTLKVVPMKTVESKICWNDSSKYWCMKPKLPPENTFSYVTFVIQPFHMAGNDQFRL